MNHSHSHQAVSYNRIFALGVVLNLGFILVEVLYGLLAHSLALIADAGHNLSDILGLLLAWGAFYLSQKKSSLRHTYGWRKTSILAALLNAFILLVAVGGIAWESLRRFFEPSSPAGNIVIWVALVGMLINSATALLFMKERKTDLNIRGAFLHMAADASVSAGVAIAGLLMILSGWVWLDPLISLLIALAILFTTWGLLRESLNLALDAVPETIDLQEVENYLKNLPGIQNVHHLHIWAMSTTETALTAHLLKPDAHDDDALIALACQGLHEKFGINHCTLQWERSSPSCPNQIH